MDLIDMSKIPDGDYKYILHLKDHYSRYSWARGIHIHRFTQCYTISGPKILEIYPRNVHFCHVLTKYTPYFVHFVSLYVLFWKFFNTKPITFNKKPITFFLYCKIRISGS